MITGTQNMLEATLSSISGAGKQESGAHGAGAGVGTGPSPPKHSQSPPASPAWPRRQLPPTPASQSVQVFTAANYTQEDLGGATLSSKCDPYLKRTQSPSLCSPPPKSECSTHAETGTQPRPPSCLQGSFRPEDSRQEQKPPGSGEAL